MKMGEKIRKLVGKEIGSRSGSIETVVNVIGALRFGTTEWDDAARLRAREGISNRSVKRPGRQQRRKDGGSL